MGRKKKCLREWLNILNDLFKEKVKIGKIVEDLK